MWVDEVYTNEALPDTSVLVNIKISTTVDIYSYSFTLFGFYNETGFGGNVLIANSASVMPNSLAASYFEEENVNILGNYFYGGATSVSNVIPANLDGVFLQLRVDLKNPDVLDGGHFLTFDEILPGANGQGTNFFTYNDLDGTPQLVDHVWLPTTWSISDMTTYDNIGQDCDGEIWGLAEWDECSSCTGGNTGTPYNDDLDCAGICGGTSENDLFEGCCEPVAYEEVTEEAIFDTWYLDVDGDGIGDGDGVLIGADGDICIAMGGTMEDNGLCTINACEAPDGFAEDYGDIDLDCSFEFDDCGTCGGGSWCNPNSEPLGGILVGTTCVRQGGCVANICVGGEKAGDNCIHSEDCPPIRTGEFDCEGVCYGVTPSGNWYSDCDSDGMADDIGDFDYICGIPVPGDDYYDDACPQGGYIISIDPHNHTFDPEPDCQSNQVDSCGDCDGPGPDCRMTCAPESNYTHLWNEENDGLSVPDCGTEEGWGPAFTVDGAPLNNSEDPVSVNIPYGCRQYIGYGSEDQYSHFNGIDICGQCFIGDFLDEHLYNYSCSGCTDDNAINTTGGALFDDGSCTFELYAGDVNRDGLVDELDLDGIAEFWNYWTNLERQGASILWFPQITQDDYWYSPADIQSTSSCAMFADADGDAIVNSGDIAAVLLNWEKTVPENYYYTWGFNGDAPSCLSYDVDQFRDNYEEMYQYIIDNYPYNSNYEDAIEYLAALLDIDIDVNYIPDKFAVHQNFPNPFNPSTSFPVEISAEADVTLIVYDLAGAQVYKQSISSLQPGVYDSNTPFTWNADGLSSGIYIYSFELSTGEIDFNKLMLIK